MKVLAINGSPRGKNSCTNKMLQPLLKGMGDVGAEIEIINLANKSIHHCIGCFACWIKTPGKCAFNDEMIEILEKIIWSDMIVYGTPLYVFTMSGLLKNMLDRTLPLALPFVEKDENGFTTHLGRHDNKRRKILLVSPCGFPEFHNFDSLISTFKQIAKASNSDYLGEILRPAAETLNHGPQIIRKSYYALLEKAGNQLIENSIIDKETIKKLHSEWISPEKFISKVNEYFESEIEK